MEDNHNLTTENNNEQQILLQETEAPDPEDALDNDSEDEGLEDYKLGGYHPVHIGYCINNSIFLFLLFFLITT